MKINMAKHAEGSLALIGAFSQIWPIYSSNTSKLMNSYNNSNNSNNI